jgi:hypothetical protein
MKKLALILALCFALSSLAHADAEVTINWSPPTTCTNGEPIGSGSCGALTRYALHCGATEGGPYEWIWGTDGARLTDTRSYTDGEYYCVMRAKNDAGFSDDSNEIHFSVTTAPPTPTVPNPPTSITIKVQASP